MKNPHNSYSQSIFFYENNLFDKALPLCSELTFSYPNEKKYWIDFSFCLHMQKKYPHAISSWRLKSLLDPENTNTYSHAAECFSLNEQENESVSLDDAQEDFLLEEPELLKSPLE